MITARASASVHHICGLVVATTTPQIEKQDSKLTIVAVSLLLLSHLSLSQHRTRHQYSSNPHKAPTSPVALDGEYQRRCQHKLSRSAASC